MVIDRMYVVVGLQPGPIVVHIGSIHRSDKEPSLISFELDHETASRVATQRDLKPRATAFGGVSAADRALIEISHELRKLAQVHLAVGRVVVPREHRRRARP
jgi:hypothetical protein